MHHRQNEPAFPACRQIVIVNSNLTRWGFLMGFWSSLCSGVSSVCSSLCSVCRSFVVGPALEIGLKIIGPILKAVTTLLLDICKALGIDVATEDVEEGKLGVMMEDVKDTVKPDDYDSTAEYIKVVKEKANMGAVNAKMEKLTQEQKEAYKLVSVSVVNKMASDGLGVKSDLKFYTRVVEMGLDDQQTIKLVQGLKEYGIEDLADVSSYLDGDLDMEMMDLVDEAMKEGLKKMDPDIKTDEQKESALNERLRIMEEKMKDEN